MRLDLRYLCISIVIIRSISALIVKKQLTTRWKIARKMSSIKFGPFDIHEGQIFYESDLCYGLVNLKPIVPGHVLIIPKRVVARFTEMTPEEVNDLYSSVHRLAPKLEARYGASALNIAMQDGPIAGQSVPHVHVHMLPRKPGDFKRNDDVYEELDNQKLDKELEAERKPRSLEEMSIEASDLRTLLH
jgi:diadenosine tetraphosphate (Ap4A) HIT family hydrolase